MKPPDKFCHSNHITKKIVIPKYHLSNSVCVFFSWFKKRQEGRTDFIHLGSIRIYSICVKMSPKVSNWAFCEGSRNQNALFSPKQKDVLSYCMKHKCLRMSQSDEHSIDGNRMEVLTAGHKPITLACFYPVRWGLTTSVFFFIMLGAFIPHKQEEHNKHI